MKSLVLYGLRSQMLRFSVCARRGTLKCYVYRCVRPRGVKSLVAAAACLGSMFPVVSLETRGSLELEPENRPAEVCLSLPEIVEDNWR